MLSIFMARLRRLTVSSGFVENTHHFTQGSITLILSAQSSPQQLLPRTLFRLPPLPPHLPQTIENVSQ